MLLRHGDFYGLRETRREVAGFSVAIAAADPLKPVDRHTHEDAHFILLLDGHYLSSARGAGHLHAEPALIYNPPGTTHRDSFPDRAGRFVGISIARERMSEVSEIAAPSEAAVRLWEPHALDVAHRIARAVPHDAMLVESLCLELVGTFVRDVRRGSRPPAWLVRAREALHDRACEQVTMGDIARDASVHPVHLARQFRRYFGCAPADYVRQRRVELAARLVRTTRRALAEIAYACGFVDQSHLNRAFAKTFATSPAAYRRRHVSSIQDRLSGPWDSEACASSPLPSPL